MLYWVLLICVFFCFLFNERFYINMAREKSSSSGTAATARRAVTFEMQDAPGRTVMLAGSFNEWQPVKQLTDKNGDGVYRCRLMLLPGEYQYKFCIDGEWRSDPANPDFVPNEFGSLNSVIVVKAK